MKNVSFRGCSEYTEHFWNMIPGEKQPDVLYQRLITAEDVIEWDNTPRQDDWGRSTIEAGMTLYMMAVRLAPKRNTYIIFETSAVEVDNTALESKVAELLVAGALLVEDDGILPIVRTYETLIEMRGVKKILVEDPRWNEIQLISQRYCHAKIWEKLYKYFIANARVFTDAELDVIVNFKNAEVAYFELFPHK